MVSFDQDLSLVALVKKHQPRPRIPPAYGVGQALAELFSHCELHVRYGVWWIERRLCPSGPIATENRTLPLWQRPGKKKGRGPNGR